MNEPGQIPAFLKTSRPGALSGKRRWIAVSLVALSAIAAFFLLKGGEPQQGQFLAESVAKGNLVVTISASGTLQPTRSVDVGSELSGTLEAVLVEENDSVKRGQVIARLDTAKLQDAVVKSRASLAQMEASVIEARGNVERLRRVSELSGGKVPSVTELEAAEAAFKRAEANRVSARAVLKTDETNIQKAVIRSPIDGVVLSREVEPGQTVAAAMTTPVLFVIAEDLTRMELQVKVDEADIGSIRPDQAVSFTVSAWPGREFPATIRRIGIGSTVTDNVVTYKTVLSVANNDLALRPGMTATARIVTANRQNVLLVPNAALRFTPQANDATGAEGSLVSRLLPRPPTAPKKTQAPIGGSPQVWVTRNGTPVSIPVRTGVSNGRYTEILDGELKEGMAVIVDYQDAAE